jgi:hypothetical protein
MKPRFRRTKNGEVINHRELVSTVTSTTGFLAVKYAINPGLVGTFPWLSTIAPAWDQYAFNKLSFEFIPRVGTTTNGTVILAPDYNAEHLSPSSEKQMSAYEGACEDIPWSCITVDLEPDSMHPLGDRKFNRRAQVGGDIKTYDVANFYISADTDLGDGLVVGKLWVEYEVEFSVAASNSPGSELVPTTTSYFAKGSNQTFTTAVAANFLTDVIYDPLGMNLQPDGSWRPLPGVYEFNFVAQFADSVNENWTGNLDLYDNGVACSPAPNQAGWFSTGTGTGQSRTISFFGLFVVPDDGITHSYSVTVVLTGAAGVLTSTANFNSVTFRLA